MAFQWFTQNSDEYEKRRQRPFVPSTITLKQLRDVVPKEAFKKSNLKGVLYALQDVAFCGLFFWMATRIDTTVELLIPGRVGMAAALRWSLWATYWYFQSLVGAGIWILGHEAGHGNLFRQKWINDLVGLPLHTFVGVPYYGWRWTHHVHHMGNASMERDENYVPKCRSDLKLPEAEVATKHDYLEAFEDTPLVTLGRLIFVVFFGYPGYLLSNRFGLGNPKYPPDANHINPFSELYRRKDWPLHLLSTTALILGASSLVLWRWTYGLSTVVKYYLVPYMLVNQWIVLFTMLHHTDPTIPHYRKGEWDFLNGSLATVDRPLLGWIGRFFLHNISHDHTAHHLFSNVPFYNLPLITKNIKIVLKDHYSYDTTYSYYALWRSWSQCLFVEDTGGIIFWKNMYGEAVREIGVREQKDTDGDLLAKSRVSDATCVEGVGLKIRGTASM